jgi:hypothetical protein
MRDRALGVVLLALSTACSAEDTAATDDISTSLSSCSPLEASTAEIELAEVLGTGVDANGTIYVIDQRGSDLRGFVSEDGELYRQRVTGTGQSNVDGDMTLLTLGEMDPPLTLELLIATDGAARMGVFTGVPATKTFIIGEQGEELTMLTPADALKLPLHDYPAEVIVEYAADVADGRLLVVLRPRDFGDYLEFRVFFGPAEHLDERTLLEISRGRDGGSTTLAFDVEGQRATASFPVEFVNDEFTPGPPTLAIDDAEVDITLGSAEQSLDGASFYCRTQ